MVIVDECHHLAAYTYEAVINAVNAKYVYGMSATPYKENGHTPIIMMQCGDIRYQVDLKNYNQNLEFKLKVIAIRTHLNNVDPSILNYTLNEINNLIEIDEERNNLIIKNIIDEFNKNKNILILTNRLEHLKILEEKLSSYTDRIFIYKGGIGKKIIKKYNLDNDYIKSKNLNKIIIATGAYIGEGFDDASLNVLFLTMPIKGKKLVTQYTGRLHRKFDNKKEVFVYDYVDDNFVMTRNMFSRRKKTYKEIGYEIIEDEYMSKLL